MNTPLVYQYRGNNNYMVVVSKLYVYVNLCFNDYNLQPLKIYVIILNICIYVLCWLFIKFNKINHRKKWM